MDVRREIGGAMSQIKDCLSVECRLLHDGAGIYVQHYNNFIKLLEQNKSALMRIAVLEQIYHDVRPISLPRVERDVESLLTDVRGIIGRLENLTGADSTDDTSRYLGVILKSLTRNIREELLPVFSPRTDQIVVPLDAIQPGHACVVGNKAANLATLRREMGVATPGGFAVTATACIDFIHDSGLAEFILSEMAGLDPESPSGIDGVSRRIRTRIMAEPLTPRIQRGLEAAVDSLRREGNALRLAVRSSAIGEDSETSFAGQYESVLDVAPEDIGHAYKTVLSSAYSTAALSYRLQHGLDDRETPMAVLVLEMVKPVFSGVLYTADPVGDDPGRISIAAVSGLGERLVGGESMPLWSCVLEKSSFRYLEKISPASSPGFFDEDGEGRALINRLWNLSRRTEVFLQRPQDIEWAVGDDGILFFLQARPLMVVEKGKDDILDQFAGQDGLSVLLDGGVCASGGIAAGQVLLILDEELPLVIPQNDSGIILVAANASTNLTPVVPQVSGLITDVGSPTSHLGTIAREFGVPALFGAKVATQILTQGQDITLWASGKKVFAGTAEHLFRSTRPVRRPLFASPVHLRVQRVLDHISPLNMTDPGNEESRLGRCRTIYDIIRFSHEQAVQRMFGFGRIGDQVPPAVPLQTGIPLRLHVLDLGSGFRAGLTSCDEIGARDVVSSPFQALWMGLSHPGLNWRSTMAPGASSFLNLKKDAQTRGDDQAEGECYAFVSGEYLNFEMRLGHHFATVGALCGEDQDFNYVQLHFSGGSAPYFGRSLRAQYVSSVLGRLGYSVVLKGDFLEASLRRLPQADMLEILDQTGRLLGSTRQLDMALNSPDQVLLLADDFFAGRYGIQEPVSPDAPQDFYVITGDWRSVAIRGGGTILQDGLQFAPQASIGVAQAMTRLLGKRYQEFLDTIEAYYYFPLAISRKGFLADCNVEVMVRPVGGHIDQAGGVAFGVRDWNNYFVFRINALEGNAILFEFKNGKRYSRAQVKAEVSSGTWHLLRVMIRGEWVSAYLNSNEFITYTSEAPVLGHVGLWTKADSVTEFRGLRVETVESPIGGR
jgi:pyruvate,water dikinase